MDVKGQEKSWIDERRSVLIKEIVRQMLLSKLFFDDLYEDYKKKALFSFQQLDRWIGTSINRGPLWILKEDAHLLFRKNPSSSFYERVFDWTLGSIFHEGMKLKENVYLLEVYQREGKAFIENGNVPDDVDIRSLLEDYTGTFTKAKESAGDEVENLHYLFSKAMEQLQRLVCANKSEGLLIRFLVENEELYERVYGPGSLTELFESIYNEGIAEAYLVAAKNYREGGWQGKALALLEQAKTFTAGTGQVKAECEALERLLAEE